MTEPGAGDRRGQFSRFPDQLGDVEDELGTGVVRAKGSPNLADAYAYHVVEATVRILVTEVEDGADHLSTRKQTQQSDGPAWPGTDGSTCDQSSPSRFTTMASCVVRAMTTTASVSGSGFSSRWGTNGGTNT